MRLSHRIRSLERRRTGVSAICLACGLHAGSTVVAVLPPVVAHIAEAAWYSTQVVPPPCVSCGHRSVVAIPAPDRVRVGVEEAA